MTDERKKGAQICARARQFLDALPLMKLENGCARARQSCAALTKALLLSKAKLRECLLYSTK